MMKRKLIKLTNSDKRATVDASLYQKLKELGVEERLRLHSSGHVIFSKNNKVHYVHRMIAKSEKNKILVPKNGKKTTLLPNNWKNVKRNAFTEPHKYPYFNKTRYRGVTADGDMFKAQISIKGKVKHLGNFITPEDAHRAYLEAAEKVRRR